MYKEITIYTDGSCHTQLKIGAWAAILYVESNKLLLKGVVENTNHNRMEIFAVTEALKYVLKLYSTDSKIVVYSDSQYVVNIPGRITKFIQNNFKTRKGSPIRNVDLLKELIQFIKTYNIEFVKVKAHLKKGDVENPNREVDKISRKLVRDYVSKNFTKQN